MGCQKITLGWRLLSLSTKRSSTHSLPKRWQPRSPPIWWVYFTGRNVAAIKLSTVVFQPPYISFSPNFGPKHKSRGHKAIVSVLTEEFWNVMNKDWLSIFPSLCCLLTRCNNCHNPKSRPRGAPWKCTARYFLQQRLKSTDKYEFRRGNSLLLLRLDTLSTIRCWKGR